MNSLFKGILSLAFLMVISSWSMAQKGNEVMKKESDEPLEEKYIDDIVQKRFSYENRVLPYEMLREADIPWQRTIWRVIETREKMNLAFRYPERSFFEILKENAEEGNIAIFEKDDFKSLMTLEALNNNLYRVDSTTTYDLETFEEKIVVTESVVNPENIARYRIKEMIYFDKESSVVRTRILGIAPLLEERDLITGDLKYELPLFWVYYPEVREVLAKENVVSDYNDAYPMTWYDLFETRCFTSYIIKASNVLDLRLKDIYNESRTADMDILLESEKIKEELFNFEHDLWTY